MSAIIAITGTKGKTSLARAIEAGLSGIYDSIVRVDSSGAYHNGELKFSDDDSRTIWGYAATNAPGRFLTLHNKRPGISILECTLFNAYSKLAYKFHNVGIFTNVFADHIGANSSIQTPEDLAEMKSFIFARLKPGGQAIFNADDKLVCAQLTKAPADVTKIAVSLKEPAVKADYYCLPKDGSIVIYKPGHQPALRLDMKKLPWLETEHKPSVYLALFTAAALFANLRGKQLATALKTLGDYSFAEDGGRMVILPLANGAKVIMDYAHEKVSLLEIAGYARSLTTSEGKVIGVLRLAPSRTASLINDTAQVIRAAYDSFYIYDKIDGHHRQPKVVKGYSDKMEAIGQVAEQFSESLRTAGASLVQTIIREDKAIRAAVKDSGKGDVIVYIVGDDPARSRQLLKAAESEEKL